MSMSAPLLIDLAGVARLADVRRPVASVWRSRFASSADPFPPVADEQTGRALFDAMAVARWLARTDRGNNPDPVADAAAAAAPDGFDIADASHVDAVDALLALRACSGRPLCGADAGDLARHAAAADPDDLCLASEAQTARSSWTVWADQLADAAYSPLEASRILERRHAATRSLAGSAGPLSTEAAALLAELGHALIAGRSGVLAVGAGIAPALADALAARVGDEVDLVVAQEQAGRGIRRRLLCAGTVATPTAAPADTPCVLVERLPHDDATTPARMLRVVDELLLGLHDLDRAVVLAPASTLTEALSSPDALVRADALRTGRVRAVVKLPAGLVASASREALALWVLGRETGDVALGDRYTAVADLTGIALSPAARADLVSDVMAAMGGARDVRAHAFRFARLVRTTSLVAAHGALLPAAPIHERRAHPARDLPALLDRTRTELGEDAPTLPTDPASATALPDVSIQTLIAERHLRMLPGTRLGSDEVSAAGLVVVGADDLDDPAAIGERRIDPLLWAARHPSAVLTSPGDVVFRTAPTAKAWVDADGSKVVCAPARVLRITDADPGGLVAEVIAADIGGATAGPGAWRRWRLRRFAPHAREPLRAALREVAARRAALARRIDALDAYADLLIAGVAAGAVTVTDPAAPAASESN